MRWGFFLVILTSNMQIPTEVWRMIYSEMEEDRVKHNPLVDVAALAQVCKAFRVEAEFHLYERIHLGCSASKRPIHETMLLFARTLSEKPQLAARVTEIHAGTVVGSELEGAMLGACILLAPNLRILELHGWPNRTKPGKSDPPGALDLVFKYLPLKRHLETLTLNPTRFTLPEGWHSSDPLCDLTTLLSYLRYLPQVENVHLPRGACRPGQDKYALSKKVAKVSLFSTHQALIQDLERQINDLRSKEQLPAVDIVNLMAGVLIPIQGNPQRTICERLSYLHCREAITSDSQLRILSEIAPNLCELSLRTERTIFSTEHNPSKLLAPSLSVWSPNLVKLVLPDYEHCFRDYYVEPPLRGTFYREDPALIETITQMPSLRVLGIPRDFIAPEHFRRGPKTLVSLDYYMSEHFLHPFAVVLRDPEVLPQLHRLCLSNGYGRNMKTGPIDAVLEARRIQFYKVAEEWEEASDNFDLEPV